MAEYLTIMFIAIGPHWAQMYTDYPTYRACGEALEQVRRETGADLAGCRATSEITASPRPKRRI